MAPMADVLAEPETELMRPTARGRHRRCPSPTVPGREMPRGGLAATGTITDVIETGSLFEDVPLVWVTMLVECADRLPYQVQTDALLPAHAHVQARIGERVALLIDRENDDRVLVRWGRPLT